MWNSYTSVFPSTWLWEQQEWNTLTLKHRKNVRRRVKIWKKAQRSGKAMSRRHNCSLGLQSLRGRYFLQQLMNYPLNLTYTYNPSTMPLGEALLNNYCKQKQILLPESQHFVVVPGQNFLHPLKKIVMHLHSGTIYRNNVNVSVLLCHISDICFMFF